MTFERVPTNPLITPSLAWEANALHEPNVLVDDLWRMWYTGGWASPSIGYATCDIANDPTISSNWTKHGQVYGQGVVETGDINLGSVHKVSGVYHMSAIRQPGMLFATSTDGLTWVTASGTSITLPTGKTIWGNRVVWHDGTTWEMLAEAGTSPTWETYRYTSADGLAWTLTSGPLTTLKVGGSYGGPMLLRAGSDYVVGSPQDIWFHSASGAFLPTDIYHAVSTDLDSWSVDGPVLTHLGYGEETDQVADPMPVTYDDKTYLFYATGNNPAERATISVAVEAPECAPCPPVGTSGIDFIIDGWAVT